MGGLARATKPLLDVLGYLLAASVGNEQVHGWAVMHATNRSRATVYSILDRLEHAEWITGRWEDNPASRRPRRRLYTLTPKGRSETLRLLPAERRPQTRPADIRADLDARARAAGYEDFEQLIRSTADWPIGKVSALVGHSGYWAQSWRAKFGVSSSVVASRVARREQKQREGLDQLPPGVQPVREPDGALRCRVCGVWRDLLNQHVARTHKLTVLQYRQRFGLDGDDRRESTEAAGIETLVNAAAEQRRLAASWPRRYQQRAQDSGFAGLAEVLAGCDDDRAAAVLGVTVKVVRGLRSK